MVNRLARLLPVFMALSSGVTVTLLAKTTYLRGLAPAAQTRFSIYLLLGLSAFSVFGHWMLARGRQYATAVQTAYFVVCLIGVTLAIQYQPSALAYGLGTAFPLLGLLVLNTSRYQDMQHELAEMRLQRDAIRALFKKYSNKRKALTRKTNAR